jgi:bifunctional UDP-N-acetylglucosamine pyrophosphorylase / glucosamine-1-phosphate N-acetyltransferase
VPELHIVILAAGKGTRMKSARPKVLHHVAGLPMIEYVLATAATLAPRSTTVVIGHEAQTVRTALKHHNVAFVVQQPQLGTAHALLSAEPVLRSASGTLVMLSGDVPLLTRGSLAALIDRHQSARAAATLVTAEVPEPSGYGRIVRTNGRIDRIVEERDASAAERRIQEINAGIYAFALEGLFDAIRSIAAQNAQREYYLPDLVEIFRRSGREVETVLVPDANEIRGINGRRELAEVSRIVRQQKNAELMDAGVTIEDPSTTYIDRDVIIGPDTIVHPGVSIEGTTVIGSGCEIHSGVRIISSRVGDGVTILNHSVMTEARIEDEARVGPFAHLRKDAHLRRQARVGNFVELKKTVLGVGSKSMHLAYLGDAVIGEKVNIGAGTITCNYDGVAKNTTTIEDGAFIGSDTQLVAPVTVGPGAYVGSGTTVRQNVPAKALAVSAGKQRNIEGWVDQKKQKDVELKSPAKG